MSDVDYRPFHYTQVFKVGWFGRRFQSECSCGWVSEHYNTDAGAGSKALLHLLAQQTAQDAPTEELK